MSETAAHKPFQWQCQPAPTSCSTHRFSFGVINNTRRREFSWTAPWQIHPSSPWCWQLPTVLFLPSLRVKSYSQHCHFFLLLLSTAQVPSYGSAQCLFYVMTARQGSFPISIHPDIPMLISHHIWVTSAPRYISGTEGRTVLENHPCV